jgi:biotin carboxyl carrier protein
MIPDKSQGPTWTSSQPKADPNILGNVGSPMKGEVIELKVAVGDPVEKGQVVAIISAMKMEMAVQVNPEEFKCYLIQHFQVSVFYQYKFFTKC